MYELTLTIAELKETTTVNMSDIKNVWYKTAIGDVYMPYPVIMAAKHHAAWLDMTFIEVPKSFDKLDDDAFFKYDESSSFGGYYRRLYLLVEHGKYIPCLEVGKGKFNILIRPRI